MIKSSLLQYAQLGWPVFPVDGKLPLIKDWRNSATADTHQVDSWWTRWPGANIGSPVARHLLIIDADNAAAMSLWEKMCGERMVPATRVCRTGRGAHFYYRLPLEAEPESLQGKTPWEGIDVRKFGNYVVLPPSLHANGRRYEWLGEAEIAYLPAWALEELRKKEHAPVEYNEALLVKSPRRRAYARAAMNGVYKDVAGAREGSRNNSLYNAACRLGQFVAAGLLEEAQSLVVLKDAGLAIGLDHIEVERTVRSGLDKGKRNPDHGPQEDR